MEENKNLEIEVTETTEEVVEEIAEEAVEEVMEETETVEEVAEEVMEEETEEAPAEEPKNSKAGVIIAILVSLVIVAAAFITSLDFNKYNRLYVDTTGKTVQDILDTTGMTLEEFLNEYGLPADMPADTTLTAAEYFIPMGKMAELNGMEIQLMKAMLGLGDDVTEETTWGDAQGKVLVVTYIGGEDQLEAFKAEYGFGDEVTAETTWGEIRNAVAEKQNELRAEQENAVVEE